MTSAGGQVSRWCGLPSPLRHWLCTARSSGSTGVTHRSHRLRASKILCWINHVTRGVGLWLEVRPLAPRASNDCRQYACLRGLAVEPLRGRRRARTRGAPRTCVGLCACSVTCMVRPGWLVSPELYGHRSRSRFGNSRYQLAPVRAAVTAIAHTLFAKTPHATANPRTNMPVRRSTFVAPRVPRLRGHRSPQEPSRPEESPRSSSPSRTVAKHQRSEPSPRPGTRLAERASSGARRSAGWRGHGLALAVVTGIVGSRREFRAPALPRGGGICFTEFSEITHVNNAEPVRPRP